MLIDQIQSFRGQQLFWLRLVLDYGQEIVLGLVQRWNCINRHLRQVQGHCNTMQMRFNLLQNGADRFLLLWYTDPRFHLACWLLIRTLTEFKNGLVDVDLAQEVQAGLHALLNSADLVGDRQVVCIIVCLGGLAYIIVDAVRVRKVHPCQLSYQIKIK